MTAGGMLQDRKGAKFNEEVNSLALIILHDETVVAI